jgi:hypothetical protein
MADLPRPDVGVVRPSEEYSGSHTDVVISRDGKAKSYRGEGSNEVERTKSIVRQIVDDPRTAEWLPKP